MWMKTIDPNQMSARASMFYVIFCLKEVVHDGLRFPVAGLDNPSTVSGILLQQPGKLKAKQIREGKEL